MKVNQEVPEVSSGSNVVDSFSAMSMTQVAYHEMDEIPVREMDILEQLAQNLERLSDLQKRLQFQMREVRYLMKI